MSCRAAFGRAASWVLVIALALPASGCSKGEAPQEPEKACTKVLRRLKADRSKVPECTETLKKVKQQLSPELYKSLTGCLHQTDTQEDLKACFTTLSEAAAEEARSEVEEIYEGAKPYYQDLSELEAQLAELEAQRIQLEKASKDATKGDGQYFIYTLIIDAGAASQDAGPP